MVGLDSLFGVWDIKTVRGRPRENEARDLMQRIADQVKPICVAHKWNVKVLEEFIPPNPGLLGMNVNRSKILIRLRPPSDAGSFYPYEALLHTMLHELTHMEIGPHNASFYKMLDELRDECEKLMRQGITGRNMPFAGDGKALGGGRAPVDARTAAVKAAERRRRQQAVMGGGVRLGGSLHGSGSAAERAAAAAEWRQAVSRGCAATQDGASSQVGGECSSHADDPEQREDGVGWDCDLCTLHNSSRTGACDACGTLRHVGDAAPLARARVCAGDPRDVSSLLAGEKLAGEEGLIKTPTVTQDITSRFNCSDADSATSRGKSASRPKHWLPARSTWTCRECPFAFPNATERRTCESCGAPRREELHVDGRKARSAQPELFPWACDVCTVVNPGTFLSCGTCDAMRAPGGAAAARKRHGRQDGFAATVIGAPNERKTWDLSEDAGAGAPHGFSTNVGWLSAGAKVCSLCTLRNTAEAFACVACGIPLAESATAESPASAGAGSTRRGDVRAGRSRRQKEGEGIIGEGGGGSGSGGEVVTVNPPDIIDLS